MGAKPVPDSAPPGCPDDSGPVIHLPPNQRLAIEDANFGDGPFLPFEDTLDRPRLYRIPIVPESSGG